MMGSLGLPSPIVALPQTRLQTKSTEVRTPISVLREVVAKDGVGGLWRGTGPSAVRTAFINPLDIPLNEAHPLK